MENTCYLGERSSLYLAFENELGRVSMNGSGSSRWGITSAEGLGLPGVELSQVSYAGEEGVHTLSSSFSARTITIGGDIRRRWEPDCYASPRPEDSIAGELRRAIRIFSRPGTLYVQQGRLGNCVRRKLACRCVAFEPSDRNGAFQPFALQLSADSPYFEDWEDTTSYLFRREDIFVPGTALGTGGKVFTRRTSRCALVNAGDVNTEPVITATNVGEAAGAGELSIVNVTTGQRITLLHTLNPGDTVTIDVARRAVTGGGGENLLTTLSPGSYLNDFWLQPGENVLAVQNGAEVLGMQVTCTFSNKYVEAIY